MLEMLQLPADSNTFWIALEALAIAAAAIFAGVILFVEFPKLRAEATARRIEGFKYAMDVLESDPFIKSYEGFNYLLDHASAGVQQRDLAHAVQSVLKSLDIIGFLIERNYLEEEFFLGQEGFRLGFLGERLSAIETSAAPFGLGNAAKLYPRGRALLHQAEKWRRERE